MEIGVRYAVRQKHLVPGSLLASLTLMLLFAEPANQTATDGKDLRPVSVDHTASGSHQAPLVPEYNDGISTDDRFIRLKLPELECFKYFPAILLEPFPPVSPSAPRKLVGAAVLSGCHRWNTKIPPCLSRRITVSLQPRLVSGYRCRVDSKASRRIVTSIPLATSEREILPV
jgi:hypothetical protein